MALAFVPTILWGPWFLVLAVVVVAREQRAIAVLVHDAGHLRLYRRGAVNDAVANWLLCAPMLVAIGRYRSIHMTHHKYLGDPTVDVDYFEPVSPTAGWLKTLSHNTVSWSGFRGALLGALPFSRRKEYVAPTVWWIAVEAIAYGVGGFAGALVFLFVWLLGRLSIFHVVSTFVIISDHFGLTSGSVLSYTRNHPTRGLMRRILHPYNNGYHVTHHLLPGIPYHALPAAHSLLSEWDDYQSAAHHERYFVGDNSVVSGWINTSDERN